MFRRVAFTGGISQKMTLESQRNARERQRRLFADSNYPIGFLGLLAGGLLAIAGMWGLAICFGLVGLFFYRRALAKA